MTTPTPTELHATIGRALVAGASAADRRAARHACLTLAAAFGEPGDVLHVPGVAHPPSVDPGQMIDMLSARLRAFVEDEGARIAAAESAAAAAATEAPSAPPPPREVSVLLPRRTPASAPARALPASPHRQALRFPLVPLPRKAP